MGIRSSEPVGGVPVRGAGKKGEAAIERVQRTGARQHGMSICGCESVGREAVHILSARSHTAEVRVQCAEPRQHGMGVCDGEPVEGGGAHGFGEIGAAAGEQL